MRRRARGLAFGVATAGCCSGLSCSLLVNTDPLVDGNDAGLDGANVDAIRAAETATGFDAEPTDAATGEAAPDAPWCATQPAHTECFDFDTVGTAGVGWDGNNISPGGAVALDTATFHSPPASMRSSVTDGTVQGGTYAVLVEDLPASATIVIAFDVQTDLPSGSIYAPNASLFELYYGGNWVIVGVSGQGPNLSWNLPTASSYESGQYTLSPLTSGPAGWTRIEATIAIGQPWSLGVTFDGKAEFQQSIPGSVTSSNAMVSAGLGVAAFGGTVPITAHYDNVTIDVR